MISLHPPSQSQPRFYYGHHPEDVEVPLQACHQLAHWACHSCVKNRQDIPECDWAHSGVVKVQLEPDKQLIPVIAEKTFWESEGVLFRDRKRLGVADLRLADLSPTQGLQAARRCQEKYGGSLARELCNDNEKGICR